MEQCLMHLLFPQWQGAGDLPALAQGARRLAQLAPDILWQEVPLTASEGLTVQDGIVGRAPLLRQFEAVLDLLVVQQPTQLFTLGGDCAVELAPIAALNMHYGPELTLVWLDAHGDLNTPVSSPSGTFHGMPLRHLLGEGDPEVVKPCHPLCAPRKWFWPACVSLIHPNRHTWTPKAGSLYRRRL
ncbi:arginase family protein [Deinococcus oregonensis]|uniref:Arginase family protein n=1 Tax=Deinococcus oregonensis TaxID=1805970 RepID=A0ABV6AV03_9DEIO